MKTVLVVDDEQAVRESIRMILEYEGLSVRFATQGAAALSEMKSAEIDLVLLDIKMPGMDGMKVLEAIRRDYPSVPVVMISGHGTIDNAVEATRLGAYEFLQKPLDRDRLLIVVRNALELKNLRETVGSGEEILGSSEKIREMLALIDRVAPTEARVLITGENGSGKELVAKAIHRRSKRASRPLVEVNCAAIPNELIESELFGHEKGAYTGAAAQRIGKFETAHRGTLFLDEIGDMSLNAQAKVLRALEEGKIERLGGNRQIEVDVRVIAATNKNLLEGIRQNQFREDLYHRLNVIPIEVPPLRHRRDDIPLLAKAFARDICRRNGMAPKDFTEPALRKLEGMEWSGNVRELRNTIERLVIMTPGSSIDAGQIGEFPASHRRGEDGLLMGGGTFQEFKDRSEAAFIQRMLEEHGWNISKTAEALDIQRSHLYNKMRKYKLARGSDSGERG